MAETPRITSASWTIVFPGKPFWRDRWAYREDWAGGAIGLVSGQTLVQRFKATGKSGRPITLAVEIMRYSDLANLHSMANSEEVITLYPEENAAGIPVVFRPDNPIEIRQFGNDMADEDKQLVGDPYDRYDVVLNLVSLA